MTSVFVVTQRVIISGTRSELDPEDRITIRAALSPYVEAGCEFGVGDCSGVDAWARYLLQRIGVRVFRADWDAHGSSAGPRRNSEMVAWAAKGIEQWLNGVPGVPRGVLLAFPGPKSKGTWDCIRKAQGAGLDDYITRIGLSEVTRRGPYR